MKLHLICLSTCLNNESNFVLQKLDPGEEEDFAGNYFKPKRATELLIKAQQDVARANSESILNLCIIYNRQ